MSEMEKLAAELSQKQAEQEKAKQTAKEQYALWVASLHELVKSLELWLEPLSRAGVVKVTHGTKAVSENPSPMTAGSYSAPTLAIEIDAKRINVEPVGRYMIGSQGVVSIKGVSKEILLGRLVENGVERWLIKNKATRGVSIETQELNEDNFARILQDFLK